MKRDSPNQNGHASGPYVMDANSGKRGGMLLERLYQTSEIPAGTSKAKAKQLRDELYNRLLEKLSIRFEWYAICSVAVEAGYQIAARKQAQRKRLRELVDILSEYIGEESPCRNFPDKWESVNMVYGYGATDALYRDKNLDPKDRLFMDFIRELLGFPRPQCSADVPFAGKRD